MSLRKQNKLSDTEAAERQTEWQQAVQELVDQVRAWAEAQGWRATPAHHVLKESFGEYAVPGLEIETPRGHLELEPIAREVMGSEGRVDFYVWPTLDRVLLLRRGDSSWVVGTDFGPKWPHPWGPGTFVELAEALLDEQ